ncbi:hypothetical protein CVT24_007303 [Panaeolus cyanescens]|uniref:Glycosyltransferase family 17 protein n=1 Tax=Panaeolus cyanescens TaxID=181874 RepID=A0A409VJA5_9AGAR|nr:hypothetical protein CVT24_007303 [Panaeolus cyanescens]
MSSILRRPRSAILLIAAALVSTFLFYSIFQNSYQLKNVFSYATRPLWDKSAGPTEVIPHFYGEGLKMEQDVCKLHGWNKRNDAPSQLKVLDAVLMSSELDLLEIRLNELDDVVDYFLIVESNATFTGLPKETFFANNRARYAKFGHKIVYHFLPGYALQDGETAWDVERQTRQTMSALIQDQTRNFKSGVKSLVLMSDLDEIPAAHTVRLLKACDFGQFIHLQLRDFLYSFEWYLGLNSWRASASIWNDDSVYRHSKAVDVMLADAGWHCSFCFRTIPEYALKMKGYSHADRIAGRINLLDPKRIQDTICKGTDIFGMLPEAYDYVDLLAQMNPKASKSAVGLPRYLIENGEKFRFLLPGGCKREE